MPCRLGTTSPARGIRAASRRTTDDDKEIRRPSSSAFRQELLVAGLDPLRDEGEEYGKKLREAGVDVVTHRYPGMIHGFVNMAGAIPQGREATLEIAKQLAAWNASESQDVAARA